MIMFLSLGCVALVSVVQSENTQHYRGQVRNDDNSKLPVFTVYERNTVHYVHPQEDIHFAHQLGSQQAASQPKASQSDQMPWSQHTVHVKEIHSAPHKQRPTYIMRTPIKDDNVHAHFVQGIPIPVLSHHGQQFQSQSTDHFEEGKQQESQTPTGPPSFQTTENHSDMPKPMSAHSPATTEHPEQAEQPPQEAEQPKEEEHGAQPNIQLQQKNEQVDKQSESESASVDKQQVQQQDEQETKLTTVRPKTVGHTKIADVPAKNVNDKPQVQQVQEPRQNDRQQNRATSHHQKKITKVGYFTRVRSYLFRRNFNQRKNLILFAAAISLLTVLVYSMILICCSCFNSKSSPPSPRVSPDSVDQQTTTV